MYKDVYVIWLKTVAKQLLGGYVILQISSENLGDPPSKVANGYMI